MTPPASTLSIIASGMQVTGDIRCNGVLRIDGILDGSILGARQLLVTPGGRVRGDVQADEIVVGGEIEGNVRASVRLELQGSAVVNGNIETRAFVVPEGGRVNGDIRMIVGEGTRVEPLLLQAPPPALPALTASAKPPIAVAVAPAPAAPSPEVPEPTMAPEPEASASAWPETNTLETGSEAIGDGGLPEEVAGEVGEPYRNEVEVAKLAERQAPIAPPNPLSKKERQRLKKKR